MPTPSSRCEWRLALPTYLSPRLTCSTGLPIAKAEVVNILEDHDHDLDLRAASGPNATSSDTELKLKFRGYEIKTVRLTLKPGGKAKTRRDSGGWVKL